MLTGWWLVLPKSVRKGLAQVFGQVSSSPPNVRYSFAESIIKMIDSVLLSNILASWTTHCLSPASERDISGAEVSQLAPGVGVLGFT
jgi:uncharacterized membrane protein YjgN (DUF898 family)